VSDATVYALENAKGSAANVDAMAAVQVTLDAEGIEFLDGGAPGVRLHLRSGNDPIAPPTAPTDWSASRKLALNGGVRIRSCDFLIGGSGLFVKRSAGPVDNSTPGYVGGVIPKSRNACSQIRVGSRSPAFALPLNTGQDARCRGAISRPSSRRALFARERL
jgi:hypothetical protein